MPHLWFPHEGSLERKVTLFGKSGVLEGIPPSFGNVKNLRNVLVFPTLRKVRLSRLRGLFWKSSCVLWQSIERQKFDWMLL